MARGRGGLLAMVFSVLGIVLVCSMFYTILTSLGTLRTASGASDFLVFTTVVGIAPTILFLVLLFGGGYAYYAGYKSISAGGGDASGIIRMVIGVLQIILFVSMFSTILSSVHEVWANSGGANTTIWIALRTVSSIIPTILFLGGIFSGVGTTVGGIRARRKRKAMV